MTNSEHDPEIPDVDELEGDQDYGTINIGTGAIDPDDFRPGSVSSDPELYVAVLLIESSSDSPGYRPLYEESFVLVSAESDEEAQEKAREYGKQHEASYEDEHHQQVKWKLKHVVEVRRVEDATFHDGTQLYSRLFRDYSSYRSFEPQISGEEV